MANVTFDAINKVYENGFHAVSDLSLQVNDGEFLVLVGPSGCGKSTALRMVAGLESISSGALSIGDRVVNDVHPKDRDIAMVFQNYALYPHMTVAENIGFALKLKKTPKDEIERRVKEASRMLELDEWLERKPGQLSGGQRQRVAMGRAIVRRPAVFLMDEPLSNLDAKLRVQMRADIAKLQRNLGVTTIYVTHDQVEAMTMGDRVAVMRKGILQQVATPQALYDTPQNLFVAAFIGSPAMNLFEAEIVDRGGELWATCPAGQLHLSAASVASHPALRGYVGRTVALGIRPENLHDPAERAGHPDDQKLTAKVELREALGSDLMVHLSMRGRKVSVEDAHGGGDDTRSIALADSADSVAVVARFGPRSAVRDGETVEFAVETERLHFFDLDTRSAIWA
ncbi:MAG: ABC transporter ATP-binding protein [Acidimicrobiia bacterium]